MNKYDLFNNYFQTLVQVVPIFEQVFEVEGIRQQIFGADDAFPYFNKEKEHEYKEKVNSSPAWQTLSNLYDYAVDGIEPPDLDVVNTVLDGAEILSLLATKNYEPASIWNRIVRLGDGRHAIDEGMDIELDKLALLANVDERTVRNAISNDILQARKIDGTIYVENTSALKWLEGRRGYQPTKRISETVQTLASIQTPDELGTFLRERRLLLEKNGTGLHAISQKNKRQREEFESGEFHLNLALISPLANYYQLDIGEFFACILRVQYANELAALKQALQKK